MADDDEIQFDYEAFQRSIERVRSGKDKEFVARPGFDPKLAKDVRADGRHGRKIEDYHQALEYLGWVYCSALELGPMWGETGPVMRTEGQWRNLKHAAKYPEIRSALTSHNICEMFPEGPESFFTWYVDRYNRARAKAAGLIVPAGLVLA